MRSTVSSFLPLPARHRRAGPAGRLLLAVVAAGLAWPLQAAEPVKSPTGGGTANKPAPKPAPKPPAKPVPKPAAKPAEAPLVPGKPLVPLLTRDELRACMARQDKLRSDGAEAVRLQQVLGQEKDAILREGESLKADLTTLDRSSAPAIEAYNARVKARDERIAAFEPQLTAYNASVGALEADRAAFARDCADRKFDEKDEEALKKEK